MGVGGAAANLDFDNGGCCVTTVHALAAKFIWRLWEWATSLIDLSDSSVRAVATASARRPLPFPQPSILKMHCLARMACPSAAQHFQTQGCLQGQAVHLQGPAWIHVTFIFLWGRCPLELAQGPSCVALVLHLARRSTPFWVTSCGSVWCGWLVGAWWLLGCLVAAWLLLAFDCRLSTLDP